MWILVAADPSPGGDTSWLEALGPFVPFGMLAVAALFFLQREMLRREGRADTRIDHLETQVSDLSTKAVEQQATLGPLLAEATRVLGEAIDALSKRQGT